MRRRARSTAIVATAAGLSATAALAATAPSLVLTPSTVRRGESVVISGSAGSCPLGDTVVILSRAFPRTHEFAGVPALWASVRAGGRFRVSTRIPTTRAVGRYAVTARCGGGNLGVLARLRVRR